MAKPVDEALRDVHKYMQRKQADKEDNCPGHVASEADPKVCGRCGIHIDSLRLDNEWEGE